MLCALQGMASIAAPLETLRFSCAARIQLEEVISPKLAGLGRLDAGQELAFQVLYPQGEL